MKKVIIIKEEVKIDNIILERGDKIEIVESNYNYHPEYQKFANPQIVDLIKNVIPDPNTVTDAWKNGWETSRMIGGSIMKALEELNQDFGWDNSFYGTIASRIGRIFESR
jgi:hypothetical protein